MIELVACTACHRHVAVIEDACPFCGALVPPAPPRPSLRGRASRAAVFAAATLAAGACKDKPKIEPAPTTGSAVVASDAPTAVVSTDAADRAGTDLIDAGLVDAALADAVIDAAIDAGVERREGKRIDKKEHLEKRRKELEKRRMQMPKPYGAPPARRRVV